MKIVLLTLALVLTACGGGGGDSPAVQSAPPVVPVVALYGDSTQQAAYSTNSTTSEAQALLGSAALLRNEGVSGTYSQQLLDGTDGKHPAWAVEMANSPARAVLINHLANDHFYPVEQYKANLIALVTIARAAGKRVVLETPNPIVSTAISVPDFDQRVAMMRTVAAETGTQLCDQYAAINAAGLAGETLDGVHPNVALYRFKGQVAAACIRAALV